MAWGTALLVLIGFFSAGTYLNSYYTAALDPIIAVLVTLGVREWWLTESNTASWRVGGVLAVAGTVGLASYLVPGSAGLRPLLLGTAVALSVLFGIVVVFGRAHRAQSRQRGLMVGAALLAVGFVPAATVADVVAVGLGPFATPCQSPATTYVTQVAPEQFQSRVTPFEREVDGLPENALAGVFYTSAVAGGLILMTGHEFLPIGGFTGGAPVPSLGQIEQLANDGEIRLAYVPLDMTDDPRVTWIVEHCARLGQPTHPLDGVTFQNLRCLPHP